MDKMRGLDNRQDSSDGWEVKIVLAVRETIKVVYERGITRIPLELGSGYFIGNILKKGLIPSVDPITALSYSALHALISVVVFNALRYVGEKIIRSKIDFPIRTEKCMLTFFHVIMPNCLPALISAVAIAAIVMSTTSSSLLILAYMTSVLGADILGKQLNWLLAYPFCKYFGG